MKPNLMRHLFPAFLFFLFANFAQASVEIPDLPAKMSVSQALYINCLQRTQTEQLLKDYLQIGLKMARGTFEDDFKTSIGRYDQRLKALNDYFLPKLDAEHQKYMTDAHTVWDESRKILLAAPTKANALILDKNFHTMISLLGKAKVLAKKSFRAVGLTGGMCRDPLYVTNIYLMKLLGVEIPDHKKKMKKRLDHFSKNMKELQNYSGNTDAIKQHLADAQKAFLFFTYMYDSDNTAVPTLIARKADKIFTSIRSIKKLYGQVTSVNQ